MARTPVFLGPSLLLASLAWAEADVVMQKLQAEVRRQYPRATLVTLEDGRLSVKVDEASGVLGLDNLRRQCTSRPADCDAAVERTVSGLKPMIEMTKSKLSRDQIRATLKPPSVMASAAAALGAAPAGSGGKSLVFRPWLAGLTMLYVVDLPQSVIYLTRENQKSLGLSDEQTDALARKNLEQALPLPTLKPIDGAPGIFAIYEGDDYCVAQLLFPARFAPLAKKLGGSLTVAAPAVNALMVTGATDATTLGRFRSLVESNVLTQPHPMSGAIFAWSAKGFSVRADSAEVPSGK